MTILVAAETLLLAVVALFVVALLRSHAEILRRLERLAPGSPPLPQPHERAPASPNAPVVEGATLDGGARRIVLSPGPDTLLAFLSTGCSTCVALLESLPSATLPPGLRLVVVSKDRNVERLRLLRPLAVGTEVVMSTEAWEAYEVPGSPYFVHVDGSTGRTIGEGSATTWRQVVDLIVDAADDQAQPDVSSRGRIDDTLTAAGIEPGHSSLYPGAAATGGTR